MTISPEAVQAALDAYETKMQRWDGDREACIKAALEAALPIMLREVANYESIETVLKDRFEKFDEVRTPLPKLLIALAIETFLARLAGSYGGG